MSDLVDFRFENIDAHPLRRSKLQYAIEGVLLQYEHLRAAHKDTGYHPGTLPLSIRIAESVTALLVDPQ